MFNVGVYHFLRKGPTIVSLMPWRWEKHMLSEINETLRVKRFSKCSIMTPLSKYCHRKTPSLPSDATACIKAPGEHKAITTSVLARSGAILLKLFKAATFAELQLRYLKAGDFE